jgi:dTDP-glucose pyrophosphorylase
MFLLQSHDVEVQRAASAALGNLAVNGMYIFPNHIIHYRRQISLT